MRYFLRLSYKGSNYKGWQRQSQVSSIQETIELALSKVLSHQITIIGCGRTDAGVHALNFYAHFDYTEQWGFDLLFRLNKQLPSDIVIHQIFPVGDKSNAQYDAKLRTYHYYLHNSDNPFLNEISTHLIWEKFDCNLVKDAMQMMVKYQDYRAFCKSPDIYNTTICKLELVQLLRNKNNSRFCFVFKSNRFLRSMIRILVYRLILVAKEEMSLDDFERYFIEKPNLRANHFAYPQGLVLYDVDYRYIKKDYNTLYPADNGASWINV